jgi:hypothetical protein
MFEVDNSSNLDSAEAYDSGHRRPADATIKSTITRTTTGAPNKILLPRRPSEFRFAPPQYYYPASRTGVMPCWGAGA